MYLFVYLFIYKGLADGTDAAATKTIGGQVAGGNFGFLEVKSQAPGLDRVASIDG